MLSERTTVVLSMGRAGILAGGLIVGGWTAKGAIEGVKGSVDKLGYIVAGLPTKADFDSVRGDVALLRAQLLNARVKCPAYVIRGQTEVPCVLTLER